MNMKRMVLTTTMSQNSNDDNSDDDEQQVFMWTLLSFNASCNILTRVLLF